MGRLGKGMTFAAWILGLGLLTVLFSGVLDRQENPNRDLEAMIRSLPPMRLYRNR